MRKIEIDRRCIGHSRVLCPAARFFCSTAPPCSRIHVILFLVIAGGDPHPLNYADESNTSIVYASPSLVSPLSRNRNTFIERYRRDNTPEVTIRWNSRTDLNFKGRPRISAKGTLSLARRVWNEEARPTWETKLGLSRSHLPDNDFQSSIYRRDLSSFWLLFRRTFSFVRTDSSSIWTRPDYPSIIIL